MNIRQTSLLLAAALFASCTATDRLLQSRDAAAGSSGAGNSPGGGGAGGATIAGAGGVGGSAGQASAGTGGGGGSGSGGGQPDGGWGWPTTLTFQRTPGLGFCIEPGQVVRAQIVPDASGGMVASGEIHRGWSDSSCRSSACETTAPLGPMPLSAAQQAELAALVAALPAGDCLPVASVVCDPCLFSAITVGGVEFMDNPCNVEWCAGYTLAVRALFAFFDRLVPQCSVAMPLKCGDRLNGSTTLLGRPNVWGGYGKTARAESGREVVYAFTADRTCDVTARLTNLTTDLDLLLMSGCDPASNTVASSTPLDLQTVETVAWTAWPGIMSYVVVDGYAGAEGNYTLEVDCTCR